MNSKAEARAISNLDNTSDTNKPVSTAAQTALALKANLNGSTYTGTHNFTGATVSGVSTTIADGSLTIAKTSSGLQTALDVKLGTAGGKISGNLVVSSYLYSNNFLDTSKYERITFNNGNIIINSGYGSQGIQQFTTQIGNTTTAFTATVNDCCTTCVCNPSGAEVFTLPDATTVSGAWIIIFNFSIGASNVIQIKVGTLT